MKVEIDSKDLAELENKIRLLKNENEKIYEQNRMLLDHNRQKTMVYFANDIFNKVMSRIFAEYNYEYAPVHWRDFVTDLLSTDEKKKKEAIDALVVEIGARISNKFMVGFINIVKKNI